MNSIQNYGIVAKNMPSNINVQKKQNISFGAQLNRADISRVANYARSTGQLPELYTMLEYLKELPGNFAQFVIKESGYGPEGIGELLINGEKVYSNWGRCSDTSNGLGGEAAFKALRKIFGDPRLKLNHWIVQADVYKNRNVTVRDIMNQAIEGEIESSNPIWEEMLPKERGFLVKNNLDKLPVTDIRTRKCGDRQEVFYHFENGGFLNYYEHIKDGKLDNMLGYFGPKIDYLYV